MGEQDFSQMKTGEIADAALVVPVLVVDDQNVTRPAGCKGLQEDVDAPVMPNRPHAPLRSLAGQQRRKIECNAHSCADAEASVAQVRDGQLGKAVDHFVHPRL